MCGVSAVFRYEHLKEQDAIKLKCMNDQMRYRGPDEEGYWSDDQCAIGQVRLSIIGLDNGTQPLFSADRSVVLVCNGEIYNYVELKQELAAKGMTLQTDTDTEVILPLYELYGTDCVKHLRGMFAFCLYDVKRKQLFVARDRIGEERIYYAEIPGGVVFSSELKAILKEYIAEPQLNVEALLAPIRFTGGINPRDTFVEQIKRVQPGEMIMVNDNGLKRRFYWQRRRTYDFGGTLQEAKQETLRLMQEAVDIEMRSDVPVAVMLSGGVDSSAVAALAKRNGREVHTITTGYSGRHPEDERAVARRFAKEQGFIYHELEMSESDYVDSFDELTAYLDEPMTDSTAIAQWAMFKKVKELGFKVLLGGMGGDELFYGYPAWNQLGDSLHLRREHEAIFPWKGKEKKLHWLKFMSHNLKWVLFAGYPHKLEDKAYGWWIHDDYYRFIENAKLTLGEETFLLNDYKFSIYKGFPIYPYGKEVDMIYDTAIDTVMIQAYLYLSDRLSMGNSLEVRSPLLDYQLVEHVMSLPLEYKYVKGRPKQYMKDVLAGIVPDYILYASKRGFTSPNSFVYHVAQQYDYRCFTSDFKFYNSVLADKVLSLLWK